MSHTSDGFASLMRVLHSKWFRQRRRLEKNVHAQVSTFSLALALLLVGLHLLRWLPDLRVHAPTCSLRGQQPTRLCLSMPSPNTIIMMSTRCRREVPGGGEEHNDIQVPDARPTTSPWGAGVDSLPASGRRSVGASAGKDPAWRRG